MQKLSKIFTRADFGTSSFIRFFCLYVMIVHYYDKMTGQYCIPSFSSSACSLPPHIDFGVRSVSFDENTFASNLDCGGYIDYYDDPDYSVSLMQNLAYSLTVTYNNSPSTLSPYTVYYGAWVDWNNDGTFDNSTERILETNVDANGPTSLIGSSFTVPFGGTFRMRIICQTTNNPTDPCTTGGNLNGEAKDFKIIANWASECSGIPNSFVVSPVSDSLCDNETTIINLLADASGYAFQWQESNEINGSYEDVASGSGAASATYNPPNGSSLPFSTTYYRCDVTCIESGFMTVSQVSVVSKSPFMNCYCTSGPFYSNASSTARLLRNVTLAGDNTNINQDNTTVPDAPYYRSYQDPVADLTTGLTYTLSTRVGTTTIAQHSVSAWIDYDQNGQFGGYSASGDLSANDHYNASGTLERIANYNQQPGAAAPGALYNNPFTIPMDAVNGETVMRVRYRYGASMEGVGACQSVGTNPSNGGIGEIQDYRVLIMSPCESPTVSPSNSTILSINTNSATLSWVNGDGDGGRIVLLRQDLPVDSSPVVGIEYTANATFGNGDQIGLNNFVIYNNIGSTVAIEGLDVNTTYHYAIFEYNTTDFCYLLNSHDGNFTTENEPIIDIENFDNVLSWNKVGTINLFPNPNNGDNISVEITGFNSAETIVRIMDATGRVLYSNHHILDYTSSSLITLPEPLTSGFYFVEFIIDNKAIKRCIIVAR